MAKLTANMVTALTGATYDEKRAGKTYSDTGATVTGWNVNDVDGRTLSAMVKRGLIQGGRDLTPKGVEERTALMGEMLSDMIAEEFTGESVEIIGDEPDMWEPEFSAPGARECFFGCGARTVAVFVDYVGRTEGLCETHRDNVQRPVTALPAEYLTTDTTEGENASQEDVQNVDECTCSKGAPSLGNRPCLHCGGDNSWCAKHYPAPQDVVDDVIIPGTHALDMGRAGYNRFVGVKESADGSLFTYGLATAISNMPGMNGTGKTNIPTMFGDIITVRTSRGNERFTVERRKYADPLLTPFTEEHANNLASHTLTDYMVTERAGVQFECTECGSIGTHANFSEFVCEGGYVPTEDDDTDGGFMETDDSEEIRSAVLKNAEKAFLINSHVRVKSGNDYNPGYSGLVTGHMVVTQEGVFLGAAIVRNSNGDERVILTEELEFGIIETAYDRGHSLADVMSTGTTHHTVTGDGKEWTRFDHVLSEGDMVKIIGGGGYGIVHATVPGLAVVYVDMGDGREPLPYGASKLVAI